MKKMIFLCILASALYLPKADAQYVRRKPGFSIGISIGAPAQRPYDDAIWVGPEWTWRNGRYVEVPGHWVRARRQGDAWRNGEWRYTRNRGYRWVPGHWEY